MHVVINALGIDNRSGTGRYIHGLLDGVCQIDPSDIRITVPLPASFPIPEAWNKSTSLQVHPVTVRSTAGRIAWEQWSLPAFSRAIRADALHTTAFVAPRFLPPSIRSIVTIHDLAFRRYPETIPRLRRLYYGCTIPASIRKAQMVITDAEAIRREVLALGATTPVEAIPLGVDPTLHHPTPHPNDGQTLIRLGITKPFVLFTGTREPRKNVSTLLKAMHHAWACGSDTRLVLAGRYGWLVNDSHWNDDRLIRVGYISHEEMAALYRSCAAYCTASLYEGFDLPSVEAQACGAPILASNIPVHREFLASATRFIHPTDVSAWTEALLNLPQRDPAPGTPRPWKDVAHDTLRSYRSVLGG